MSGGARRHEDNAVEPAGLEQAQDLSRKPRRRDRPVEHGLPHREALASSADFRSKASVSPERCTSGPAFGSSLPTIRRDKPRPFRALR